MPSDPHPKQHGKERNRITSQTIVDLGITQPGSRRLFCRWVLWKWSPCCSTPRWQGWPSNTLVSLLASAGKKTSKKQKRKTRDRQTDTHTNNQGGRKHVNVSHTAEGEDFMSWVIMAHSPPPKDGSYNTDTHSAAFFSVNKLCSMCSLR